MEDGNFAISKDDKCVPTALGSFYSEESAKSTANGHELNVESCSPLGSQVAAHADTTTDETFHRRVNPLKIHLGKRPFVDNSYQYNSDTKKKAPIVKRPSEPSALPKNSIPRTPKLIPKKKINRSQFQNVASHPHNYYAQSEQDKPVPRLVPKSQLHHFKQSAVEKNSQLNEHFQNAALQPTVKYKCRKCCSMSFKTLAMLKEHQLVCRAQSKEPSLSSEAITSVEATSSGEPSRVTKKVYLCSACGTYYENWNLFLHMREVHNRHICLFCLGMFSKADKLSTHLTNKHNVQDISFDSKEDFTSIYNGTFYLMCCECDEIYSEQNDYMNHVCEKFIPKPLPILVSKSAVKINNMKQMKNINDSTGNGPATINKEPKSACDIRKPDKSNWKDSKPQTITTQTNTFNNPVKSNEAVNCDTTVNSESTLSTTDFSNSSESKNPLDNSHMKLESSPRYQAVSCYNDKKDLIHNGDDSMDYSDKSDSPVPMDIEHTIYDFQKLYAPKKTESQCPPIEKENCGIKLKLSLNKANSPVIINSTVDPTVGQKNPNKPPVRSRRPPKRYEKDAQQRNHDMYSRDIPVEPVQPRTPSIKMTICDKANSPFVKTTIYENNPESTMKTLVNNNLETASTMTPTNKSENVVLSTIYDNNLEDVNTMNRVPKLTVRLPKELLDRDSSSDYSSDSDASEKLTVDDKMISEEPIVKDEPQSQQLSPSVVTGEDDKEMNLTELETVSPETPAAIDETTTQPETIESQIDVEKIPEEPPVEEIPVIELKLNRPLDKYPLKELLKLFLASTIYNCIYCNYVRKVAINCEQLALHMAAQHRFSATVDSITAEELMPETISTKVKGDSVELNSVFMNLDTYDSEEKSETVLYDHLFECFQCYFKTPIHKDLYLHNRKMHQKTILLCVMCKTNFYSYSELLCHLCPGTYDSEYEIMFRCCLCNVDSIPSSFRLMVHLRKVHNACDVCLEFCHNQSRLSNHVWKHKLHHLCYRCGIAYRNKPDITKHLFWKHGTESVLCKRCLQKKWPHIYHFCTPPAIFVCDECSLQFTRAVYLKVHKRFHSNEFPHACSEEGCTDKFVSKKLLMKHLEEHQRKLATVDLEEKKEKDSTPSNTLGDSLKEPDTVIDLVNVKPTEETAPTSSEVIKTEGETAPLSKKAKKRKQKEKEALLLDVNLPELNLSESDSSDESDSGISQSNKEDKPDEDKLLEEKPVKIEAEVCNTDVEMKETKKEEKAEPIEDEKPDEQQVLDIWDNFKKYQEKTEKPREKTPPLVPIRKHVCESDHDYCLVPTDFNGTSFNSEKKKNKKKDRRHSDASSSSSSSSDSSSSCSCGSNCSCSSSSGSSSSSSSDSDSSDQHNQPDRIKLKKPRGRKPTYRRASNGSNVDVMGMSETPILIPEKTEPPIAETDLETNESDTDEEFYDEHPQRLANKWFAEKRNQLMLLASVAPSDGGSTMSGEASRPVTPAKEEIKEKREKSSSKKKSKKKKRSKSKRHESIKINIPKEIISKAEPEVSKLILAPNKITISLQSNTVQIPPAIPSPTVPNTSSAIINTPTGLIDNKRASKRRRVPNKFYGYSSDEDAQMTPQLLALKPQQPPKLEWRKEDLPSPVTHRAKKELPSSTIAHKFNYVEPIRLKAPIPDPEPPRILMNTESMESSDSDSSEGALEIYQPSSVQKPIPVPPPTYLNSGTSSLPYAFQRPAGRQAREGESVYCYCRCPYDEVSEMIACDADGCSIEWFHFECVGIMVPPKGKWYCPECRKKQSFSGYR